ncbi:MAG TPA: hypothetical protein H9733_03525 [Candidatus Anaerotignum merdipullorum]|nr:hypothetical protein [Candidatus Anaerotignum merdipullorum]
MFRCGKRRMDSPLFQKREEAVGEVALGSIDALPLGGRKESPCDVQLGNGKRSESAANPENAERRLQTAPIPHLVRTQINYKCILILFHTSNANNRPFNTLAKAPSICYHTEECIHMMEENSKKTEKYKMNTKVYECSVKALHLYYKCIYMYIIRKQRENSNQISDVI